MKFKNEYQMEDIIPIVSTLAEQYTGFESTSVTYEKAQQFMGAVLYCINETKMMSGNNLYRPLMSAEDAYQTGYQLVIGKVNQMREQYNRLTEFFCCYDNECLQDTVIKGIPEFLKWYDAKYNPQDTILTLDYPIVIDLSSYSGIDAVYEYMNCIWLEQIFLHHFNEQFIVRILQNYCGYAAEEAIENIFSIVLTDIVMHFLLKKPLDQEKLLDKEWEQLRIMMNGYEKQEANEQVFLMIRKFVDEIFGENDSGIRYVKKEIQNIVSRIRL